jgi:hypothetical protein
MTATTERPLAEAPPPVESLDAGVIEEARARQRRHRTVAAAAVVVTVGIVSLVIGLAGGGGNSHGVRGSLRPSRAPSTSTRTSFAACVLHSSGHAVYGKPSEALLSILGVLRRPATPADALPAKIRSSLLDGPPGREIFVNYIRRARVTAGVIGYWVYPEILDVCGRQSPPSMALWEGAGVGSGVVEQLSGAGLGTAAGIEQGSFAAALTSSSFTQTTIQMLIPDGVATVALHYPAGIVGGFNRHHVPAATVTTDVVGNLMVATIPRGGQREAEPDPMIWRAANGRVVLTEKCKQTSGPIDCTTTR